MAFDWTDAELNAKADDTAGRIVTMHLHTGAPGVSGTANQATGGSPAYAPVTLAFEPAGDEGPLGASDQPATVGVAWAAPSFNLPPGDYTHYSYRGAASVFLGSDVLPSAPYSVVTQEVYSPNVAVGPGPTGMGA